MLNVVKTLFSIPGLLTFSEKSDIETQREYYSPIYINMKILLKYPKERRIVAQEVSKMIIGEGQKPSLIVGQESGANYIAAAVADLLDLQLAYVRRTPKEYGKDKEIVGFIESECRHAVFVDDVLATGKSLVHALGCMRSSDPKRVSAVYVLDYGYRTQIEEIAQCEIRSLVTIEEIINYAMENGYLTANQVKKINEHVATFQTMVDELQH